MNWKRLELTTVTDELWEGLEARTADPLWLMARQWQNGEFHGEDAGSPALVKATVGWAPLQAYRPIVGERPGPTEPLTDPLPLEARVEAEPESSGDVHEVVEAGLDLLRTLALAEVPAPLRAALVAAYPVELPEATGLDPVGRRRLEVLAARSVDTAALRGDLRRTGRAGRLDAHLASETAENRAVLREALIGWAGPAPGAGEKPRADSWDSTRMEHRFEVGSVVERGGVMLEAEGWEGGRLDWHTFDISTRRGRVRMDRRAWQQRTLEVLPTPLRFAGMPASRFWEMEDADVYFGGVEAAPDDLARLIVAGFATVYGDDWFVVPCELPVGSVTRVISLEVLDNYGMKHDVSSLAENDGRRRTWRFFEMTGDRSADLPPKRRQAPLLLLAPALASTEQSRPREEVVLARDEISNLAWAVERKIEGPSGRVVDREARWREREPDAPPPIEDDAWRYVLSGSVADYWVPLVPVRIAETGEMVLQRGRMPTDETGDGGVTRGALGKLLKPNEPLFVAEHEVPTGGVRVIRRHQTARDAEGGMHLWTARRKLPDHDPIAGGLSHDELLRGDDRHE